MSAFRQPQLRTSLAVMAVIDKLIQSFWQVSTFRLSYFFVAAMYKYNLDCMVSIFLNIINDANFSERKKSPTLRDDYHWMSVLHAKKKKKKRKWKEKRNKNWRHINLHPDQANRKFIQQRRKLINVCGIALSIIDPDSVACKDAA